MTRDEEYRSLLAGLIRAYKQASRKKRGTRGRLTFEMACEEELVALAREIMERRYSISPSVCFVVEKPVFREIVAAHFRDRIVHHYIHAYLEPRLERELIHDCYSCRRGKGTHFGISRLEHHIRSATCNYQRRAYILQLDIRGYFMSINRRILLKKATDLMHRISLVRDKEGRRLGDSPHHGWVEYLLELVIMQDPIKDCVYRGDARLRERLPRSKSLHYSPEGCGLPIGNLTSQLMSNLYLCAFDQYVKRSLGCRHYGRYVDDFYIVDTDRERLLALVPEIDKALGGIGLRLHPNKVRLRSTEQGATFLGVHLRHYRHYVSRSLLARIRRAIDDLSRRLPAKGRVRRLSLVAVMNSYLGLLMHTRSYRIRLDLVERSGILDIAHAMGDLSKLIPDGWHRSPNAYAIDLCA